MKKRRKRRDLTDEEISKLLALADLTDEQIEMLLALAEQLEARPLPSEKHMIEQSLPDQERLVFNKYMKEGAEVGDSYRKVPTSRRSRRFLSDVQVDEIRSRYAKGGVTLAELAAEYGVTQGYVWRIVKGRART
jgi:transcriptional regulator with XRE-family HTH domain